MAKQGASRAEQRRICPKGSVTDGWAHCYHISAPPFIAGGNEAHQFPELCCHCSPSYFRLNILVLAMSDNLKQVMEEHPIYNFTVTQQKSSLALPNQEDVANLSRRA